MTRADLARSGPVDSLRAIAMGAVMAIHAHLLPFGWIGVWLFYVISGYVVTLSILTRDPDEPAGRRLAGFLRRRVARIVPLLYLYVAVGLAVTTGIGIATQAITVASLLLFFNNLTMIVGVGAMHGWPSGHLWTLSVEMQFYLLYGLLLCLAPRAWTMRVLVALLVAAPIGRWIAGDWLLASGWPPLDAAFAVYAAPGLHSDIFAMGALLAFAQAGGRLERLAPRIAVAGGGMLAFYAVAYVGVNATVRHAHGSALVRNVISGILIGEHREAFLYSCIGGAMSGLVALAATRHRLVMPLLGSRLLAGIGLISYGGYVFHQLGLRIGTLALGAAGLPLARAGVAGHLLQLAIGAPVALALAWASYRWWETPVARRLTRRAPSEVPAPQLALDPR